MEKMTLTDIFRFIKDKDLPMNCVPTPNLPVQMEDASIMYNFLSGKIKQKPSKHFAGLIDDDYNVEILFTPGVMFVSFEAYNLIKDLYAKHLNVIMPTKKETEEIHFEMYKSSKHLVH